jgi:H+/Cl- antiporter ClcA
MDRQTVGNIVPLAAVVIALAEYLLDHTYPRYASPWFWIALVATVGLLVLVQVLRFRGASKPAATKPDYSASSIIRRRTDTEDRG